MRHGNVVLSAAFSVLFPQECICCESSQAAASTCESAQHMCSASMTRPIRWPAACGRLGDPTRSCPRSREEIVNACGVDDFHDGVNYTRTSCVIAVSKAKDMFEPFLHQVR